MGIEIGLLGQVVRNKAVQQTFSIDDRSIEDAKALIETWAKGNITHIEKTRFTLNESDGGMPVYTLMWDSTPAEAGYSELETISRIVDREKQSQMVQRLIQFSGQCLELIMGIGLLKLDDIVAEPFKPKERYSEQDAGEDIMRGVRI